MSLLDGLLDRMQLNTEDEYEEELEYEEENDDYEYEEDDFLARFFSSRKANKVKKAEQEEEVYQAVEKPRKSSAKIVPMRTSSKKSKKLGQVCIVRPVSMEDIREVADLLLDHVVVVVNMEGIDIELAQRMFDFMTGVCVAISGNMHMVSGSIFALSPSDDEIYGDSRSVLKSHQAEAVRIAK